MGGDSLYSRAAILNTCTDFAGARWVSGEVRDTRRTVPGYSRSLNVIQLSCLGSPGPSYVESWVWINWLIDRNSRDHASNTLEEVWKNICTEILLKIMQKIAGIYLAKNKIWRKSKYFLLYVISGKWPVHAFIEKNQSRWKFGQVIHSYL